MTVATSPTIPSAVVWDYQTVTVARPEAEDRLTALEIFGWTLQDHVPPVLGRRTATFFLRRDRAIADRDALNALEDEYQDAVTEADRLRRSPERVARTVAVIAGLIGVAYMGGAVFAYLGGGGMTYYMLAIVAFAHCLLPAALKKMVHKKRFAKVAAPLLDQQQACHDILHAARALRRGQPMLGSTRR